MAGLPGFMHSVAAKLVPLSHGNHPNSTSGAQSTGAGAVRGINGVPGSAPQGHKSAPAKPGVTKVPNRKPSKGKSPQAKATRKGK